MKKAKAGREVSPLPRNMEVVKRDFQKVRNMFFARSKVVTEKAEYEFEMDKKEVPVEAKALFWVLMQEFEKYLNEQEASVTEELYAYLEDKEKKEILLYEYGIKVVFDDEAKWFFQKELTKEDWAEYDKACNKKFKEELLKNMEH